MESMKLISSIYSNDDDDFAPEFEAPMSTSPEAEVSYGSQAMDLIMDEPEFPEVGEPVKDFIGVMDNNLPPPPKAKCSDEQQKRINKFLSLKRLGKSYNAEVRNKKEYRNPDFLRHAVTYQDIDEIGSCFAKEVFDPHGYDKSDFYDEIAVSTVTAGGLRPLSAAVDSTARDGRNKKSKWDKVDSDQTSGAHAALSTAANAGAGYAAFAQRRRETEEKKYIKKKIDRRS